MIQRIQTVWLLLASVTLIFMLFLPIMTGTVNGHSVPTLYTRGFAYTWDLGEFTATSIKLILPLIITHIVIILLCFINIFNFKKRSLQKRITIGSIILIIGFAFWCSVYAKKLSGGIEGANFGIGAYLPALAILFLVLAIFGINKDERLIRSAERLR